MSLLLDALKKAAEQKAEKSRQETHAASPSDETEIGATADDVSELEQSAGHSLQQSQRDWGDETELDISEIQTRLERTRLGREEGGDTELEVSDSTPTRTPSLSAQMQTGEDESIIFAAEDVSDFMGEPALVNREPQDETELSQLAADRIDLSRVAPQRDETELSQLNVDATDLSQVAPQQDETELSQLAVDATDLSRVAPQQDETELSQLNAEATDLSQVAPQQDMPQDMAESADDEAREDDTDISQPFPPGDMPAPGEQDGTVDETHINQLEESISAEETDLSRSSAEAEDAIDDEDMSLLLVDRDDTNLTTRTSVTDQQTSQEITQVLAADAADTDGLALVDITQHRVPDDVADTPAATQTSSTATTGIVPETQVTQSATARLDSTSTRTYAPDNYDRTLVRLPSDDASKIFAGMRSDSDIVMTPDYAKQVFHSKSSAQRVQAYKAYAGISIVILLMIGIYGAYEFQDESSIIDSSLRPLKRDPMPGIIKPEGIKQDTNLFAESGTDARTIEIIESADNVSETVVMNEGVIGDEVVIADEAMPTDNVAITESTAEVDNSTVASAAPVQTESPEATQSVSIIQAEVVAAQPESSSSALKIISSSQVEQKVLWLHEAFNAYQSGNDSLAMTRYNQVLEVDPGNRNALLARAAINVQNNNSNAAIKDYQTLLLHNPKDSLAMTSLIAVANVSPRETESQLKLMIRDEPNSPYLNFALANAYGAQNRWQEAQRYYFKALENNPGDPNYAYNLAVSLEHIAQPLAAVSYYRRALDNINNSLATFNREIVNQRMETLAKK